MKKQLLLIFTLFVSVFSFSQGVPTLDNVKVGYDDCGKINLYFINTINFNIKSELNNGMSVYIGFTELSSVIYDKYNVGDTVIEKVVDYFGTDSIYVNFYTSQSNTFFIKFDKSKLHQKLDSYRPCYVTIETTSQKPTIFFEGIEGFRISYFNILRNGQLVTTVPFTPGESSYTDYNNTDALNYTQEYRVNPVDSCGNEIESSTVTTIHARNLSSVYGNIEMDWTVPSTARPINNFKIYELIDSTLTLVATLPPNITQYTVNTPNQNASYLVGIDNVDCIGTDHLKSIDPSKILLSNRVKTGSILGSTELSLDDDTIVGYYDFLGRSLKIEELKDLVLVHYRSGKTIKKILKTN